MLLEELATLFRECHQRGTLAIAELRTRHVNEPLLSELGEVAMTRIDGMALEVAGIDDVKCTGNLGERLV